jgi:hypothetical protein
MARAKAKPEISPEEARAFAKRWQAVNEFELNELRSTSAELKFQQLCSLWASVSAFGWTEALAREEGIARERWAALRRVYGA